MCLSDSLLEDAVRWFDASAAELGETESFGEAETKNTGSLCNAAHVRSVEITASVSEGCPENPIAGW